MSDITVEKKLAALKEIRSTYSKNQYDLSKRERILYGKSARDYHCNNETMDYTAFEMETLKKDTNLSLKIRFAVAIALMIGIILIDQNSHTIAGISAGQILQTISYDYTDMLETWIRK